MPIGVCVTFEKVLVKNKGVPGLASMKTRQKRMQAVDTTLVSVPELIQAAETKEKTGPGRGGRRPNSGRKPIAANEKKESPAYVSMTDAEKRVFRKQAKKAKLSLSFFLRQKLGLPISMPAEPAA